MIKEKKSRVNVFSIPLMWSFIVLVLILVFLGLSVNAFAANEVIAEGDCGPEANYQIIQNGDECTMVIAGKGEIDKTHLYLKDHSTGERYNITKLVIKEGITEIKQKVFSGYRELQQVTLPSTMKTIGGEAFREAKSLRIINLTEGLETIDEYAFDDCESLQDLKIPSTVSYLGRYVFRGCDSLKNMEIPSTVTTVVGGTFVGCNNLEQVTVPDDWTEIPPNFLLQCPKIESFRIPENVRIIRMGAFQETGLQSIVIPDSVEEIQNHPVREQDQWASADCRDMSGDLGAFWQCTSLKKVKFSKNLKSLGNRTFVGCTSLEEVELPANLTQLGDDRGNWGVFCDCSSMKEITIPRGLKKINEWVFLRCDNLSDLYYEGTESEWKNFTIEPMGNYNYTSTARVHYNCYKEKTFRAEDYHGEENLVIPEGYTRIDEYALQNAKTLKSVSLPTSLEYIGYYAFQNCTGLKTVTIPGSVKYITRGAFNGCTGLTEVKIASGVKLIGTDTEGKYSGQVKPSGYGTFEGCTDLKTLYLPKSVTSIGEYSFYNCPALKDVYYEGTKKDWSNIPIVNGSNQPVITVATKHFNSAPIVVREANCPSAKFTDVNPGEWYHPYVDFAIFHGIMAGTSSNRFSPNDEVTRATMVQVLYAMENKPGVIMTKKFSDVGETQWYSAAVSWASMNNIVGGYPDGTFRPNKSISRQDMAVMIYAYGRYKGMDMTGSGNVSGFKDQDQISNYARTAIQWCVAKKYLSGTDGNRLAPKGTTTRAQLATVMKAVVG